MIDNFAQVARLLSKLEAALPLVAHIPPELAEALREDSEAGRLPAVCQVTEVSYAGDEGGIMCRFHLGPELERPFFVSITHLRFDGRSPFAGEIAAYQKRRVRRIRRLAPPAFVMART
jgi:hypothetical protein